MPACRVLGAARLVLEHPGHHDVLGAVGRPAPATILLFEGPDENQGAPGGGVGVWGSSGARSRAGGLICWLDWDAEVVVYAVFGCGVCAAVVPLGGWLDDSEQFPYRGYPSGLTAQMMDDCNAKCEV